MTRLTSLLSLADEFAGCDDGACEGSIMWKAGRLATSISALLSPPNTCGWERPLVIGDGGVSVPDSWGDSIVSPDDARAMAVMLLLGADEAEGQDQ